MMSFQSKQMIHRRLPEALYQPLVSSAGVDFRSSDRSRFESKEPGQIRHKLNLNHSKDMYIHCIYLRTHRSQTSGKIHSSTSSWWLSHPVETYARLIGIILPNGSE